jgi:FtsP/CotA-like multicopper oxidase with cupredoxin domain
MLHLTCYADLQVDAEEWEIVAMDGMPLAFHDPRHSTRRATHVLLPPAGRLEAVISGPPAGVRSRLRSRCFDTGPDGDPNPSMALADLVSFRPVPQARNASHAAAGKPVITPLPNATARALEKSAPDFTVTFTEDKQGFYINGQRYSPADAPMTRVRTGGYHHWRIVNKTREVHPFHIHQVHLFYAVNERPAGEPEWLDTVNVPVEPSRRWNPITRRSAVPRQPRPRMQRNALKRPAHPSLKCHIQPVTLICGVVWLAAKRPAGL